MEALKQNLKNETEYLNGQIAAFSHYLDEPRLAEATDGDQTDAKHSPDKPVVEQIPDYAIGNIRLAVGQSNLFINERFKQFANLIVDSEAKRGEKEVKLEDLEGFWEMISYQIDDLKVKWKDIEDLRQNNWIVTEPLESVKAAITNGNPLADKANIYKNPKAVPKAAPKAVSTDKAKPAPKSNFRDFLRARGSQRG